MSRYLRQEAYHELRPVDTIVFNSPKAIICLHKAPSDMIGFGMDDVPAINKHRYLGENDNCYLVICSDDNTQ
jgi:hypothetical protein